MISPTSHKLTTPQTLLVLAVISVDVENVFTTNGFTVWIRYTLAMILLYLLAAEERRVG